VRTGPIANRRGFVCLSFADVSVNFERSEFLALAVEVESSGRFKRDSRGPRKGPKGWVGACRRRKKRGKNVGQEDVDRDGLWVRLECGNRLRDIEGKERGKEKKGGGSRRW